MGRVGGVEVLFPVFLGEVMRVTCQVCGRKVFYYNPRVGKNRTTRYCEHKNDKGEKCAGSRKPVNNDSNS